MHPTTAAFYRKSPRPTPDEFENEVKKIINAKGAGLKSFRAENKHHISTVDGTYEIDVYAEFEALGGNINVIIECKRYANPVNRDIVLALHEKMRSVGAQKAMLFATSGFQKGAVLFARRQGIALVKLADGRVIFVTKSQGPTTSWPVGIPRFVALLRPGPGAFTLLGQENPEAFTDWLVTPSRDDGGVEDADDIRPEQDASIEPEDIE